MCLVCLRCMHRWLSSLAQPIAEDRIINLSSVACGLRPSAVAGRQGSMRLEVEFGAGDGSRSASAVTSRKSWKSNSGSKWCCRQFWSSDPSYQLSIIKQYLSYPSYLSYLVSVCTVRVRVLDTPP